jgi:polyisoprenoid-binding protein YceI
MKRLLVLVVIASAAMCAAQSQTWQIDPNHTASQFAVRHLGISTVRGQFMKTTGTVVYDPADLSKTQIDITIDAASVDTRVQMRDNDLRSPHFLDVEKYPTITFKAKKTESAGQGKLKITGDLTIHGVTKEVVLDVDGPTPPMTGMGSIRMGAEATTKIDRKDFGITFLPGVVGDEIQITLDVELMHPAK